VPGANQHQKGVGLMLSGRTEAMMVVLGEKVGTNRAVYEGEDDSPARNSQTW